MVKAGLGSVSGAFTDVAVVLSSSGCMGFGDSRWSLDLGVIQDFVGAEEGIHNFIVGSLRVFAKDDALIRKVSHLRAFVENQGAKVLVGNLIVSVLEVIAHLGNTGKERSESLVLVNRCFIKCTVHRECGNSCAVGSLFLKRFPHKVRIVDVGDAIVEFGRDHAPEKRIHEVLTRIDTMTFLKPVHAVPRVVRPRLDEDNQL
jgi:hypothetical protein